MNREGIRKPAWFAYKYLNMLGGREIPSNDQQAIVTTDGRKTGVLLWNWVQPDQKASNRPFFTKLLPAQPSAPATVEFANLKPGYYRLTVRRTGFRANDAYSRYLEMGSPKDLTPAQLDELQDLTRDVPESARQVSIGSDGRYSLQLPMRTNDVVLLQLEPAASAAAPERG